MALTLFLVTLVAAAALGFVFEKTKGPIAIAEAKKLNSAIERVAPKFDNIPANEKVTFSSDIEGDSIHFYIARKYVRAEDSTITDSTIVGYAIESFSKNAFAGKLRLLAGFTLEGKIKNIAVLEHKETPGLGTKMTEPKFANQFLGKDPKVFSLKVKKDDGEVQAITASTITSRAYCEAVQRAYNKLIEEYIKKEGDKE